MLNKTHLARTKIKKEIFKPLKKPKLVDVAFKMPKELNEIIDLIQLCEKIATFSYIHIPEKLEEKKLSEGSKDLDYAICLLRRNVYQGHAIKDICLLNLLSRGEAVLKGYTSAESMKKTFAVIDLAGNEYIVRVSSAFVNQNPMPDYDYKKVRLDLSDMGAEYLMSDDFVAVSYGIRHMYIRWHDAFKKLTRKIMTNNEVYYELAPMVKAGQIKLTG